MNHQKFGSIAHRDHDCCNPISTDKIEQVLDLLSLGGASRVRDLRHAIPRPSRQRARPGTRLP
jgi:hypothetical protein